MPVESVNKFIDTVVIPATDTLVIDGDCDIVYLEIVNEGGQANPKVTITDNQATPRACVFKNTPVPTGGVVTWGPHPAGKRATGGLRWSQDTANALVGHIQFRQPPYTRPV